MNPSDKVDLIWRMFSLGLGLLATTATLIVAMYSISRVLIERAREKSVGAEAIKRLEKADKENEDRIRENDNRHEAKYKEMQQINEKFRFDMVKLLIKIPD